MNCAELDTPSRILETMRLHIPARPAARSPPATAQLTAAGPRCGSTARFSRAGGPQSHGAATSPAGSAHRCTTPESAVPASETQCARLWQAGPRAHVTVKAGIPPVAAAPPGSALLSTTCMRTAPVAVGVARIRHVQLCTTRSYVLKSRGATVAQLPPLIVSVVSSHRTTISWLILEFDWVSGHFT